MRLCCYIHVVVKHGEFTCETCFTAQVLQDVTAEEFQQFVDVLLQLRTMATRKGAQDLVDIVANQADLSSDFQVSTNRV